MAPLVPQIATASNTVGVITLKFEPMRDRDGVPLRNPKQAVKWLLRYAKRTGCLRCISIHEEKP